MKRATCSLVALLLAAGCGSVAAERELAESGIAALLHERTGHAPGPRPSDDGELVPLARELLGQPLVEETAVRIALLNNRRVAEHLAQLGVHTAERVEASRLANPLLTANAKFFDSGTEVELGITESLLDVFFVGARRRIAESEFEAARLHIAELLVRLVHDVKRAFVEVRVASAQAANARDVLRTAQAAAELMAELHRAGNVIDPDLTTEELALARAQRTSTRAEAALAEARESVNVLLGLWDDAVAWTIEGALPEDPAAGLDLEGVELRALHASLELSAVRAEATAQARRLGMAGWESVLSPGEIGVVAKQEPGESEWGLGPAIGLSLPLFQAGDAPRAAAAAGLEAVRARHVATAVEVRSAARRLRERSRALTEQARSLREIELPKSSRLVRETLRNYNAMQIGVFDVFVARQQEIEVQQGYLETLGAAWTARIDLEELLAGSLNEARLDASSPVSTSHASGTAARRGH